MVEPIKSYAISLGYNVDPAYEKAFLGSLRNVAIQGRLIADMIVAGAKKVAGAMTESAKNFRQMEFLGERTKMGIKEMTIVKDFLDQAGANGAQFIQSLAVIGDKIKEPGLKKNLEDLLKIPDLAKTDALTVLKKYTEWMATANNGMPIPDSEKQQRYRQIGVEQWREWELLYKDFAEFEKKRLKEYQDQGFDPDSPEVRERWKKWLEAWEDFKTVSGNIRDSLMSKFWNPAAAVLEEFSSFVTAYGPTIRDGLISMLGPAASKVGEWSIKGMDLFETLSPETQEAIAKTIELALGAVFGAAAGATIGAVLSSLGGAGIVAGIGTGITVGWWIAFFGILAYALAVLSGHYSEAITAFFSRAEWKTNAIKTLFAAWSATVNPAALIASQIHLAKDVLAQMRDMVMGSEFLKWFFGLSSSENKSTPGGASMPGSVAGSTGPNGERTSLTPGSMGDAITRTGPGVDLNKSPPVSDEDPPMNEDPERDKAMGGRENTLKGLDPEMRARVRAMYADMPEDVRKEFMLTEGFRTREYQQYLWNTRAGRGMVAPPGGSNHEDKTGTGGRAVDVKGNRAREWLYAHPEFARKYGLGFFLKGDAPHMTMDPGYSGPSYAKPEAPGTQPSDWKGVKADPGIRTGPLGQGNVFRLPPGADKPFGEDKNKRPDVTGSMEIHIHDSGDPMATAHKVASAQKGFYSDLVRNSVPAVT